MAFMTQEEINVSLFDEVKRLQKEVAELKAERDELKIDVTTQLPTYKALRESFMDGVYWYEQSYKVSQIELDKAAREYANRMVEGQADKDGE